MPSPSSFSPFLLVIFLVFIPIICNASPINRQVGISDNVFMTTQNGTDGLEQRVCSIDAVTYRDGETIPTSSPCEHCVCRPPGFACTITSCEYRPGCRALRRPDRCCPEYQCECELDGKIYQNGDKVVDNNNPCAVCYCQGGEILCSVIDCYWRNDCPPRYIDNRCCPMYDHCPPPQLQGPIRHRLPTTSTTTQVPISWHNLTQGSIVTLPPPPPSTSSEAPLTSTSTTTEESSPVTSVPVLSDVVSEAVAVTEHVTPQEPESSNLVQSDDQEVPAAVTTTLPVLEASVQDNLIDDHQHHDEIGQETTTSPLQDDNQGLIASSATRPLPTDVNLNPTSTSDILLVPTGFKYNSTVASSEHGSLVVGEPTAALAAVLFSAVVDKQPIFNDDATMASDDADAINPTTSEPSNDEPSEATTIGSTPLLQDETVTERQQSDDATIAPAPIEDANILTDATPTESNDQTISPILNDDPQQQPISSVTESEADAISNDDAGDATTAAFRHDLFVEGNTQSPSESELERVHEDDDIVETGAGASSSAASAQTTSAPVVGNNEELVYADEAQVPEIETTERQQNDDAEENEISVTTSSSFTGQGNIIVNDGPSEDVTTAASGIFNDESEQVTQQDSTVTPSNMFNDDLIPSATDQPLAPEDEAHASDDIIDATTAKNIAQDFVRDTIDETTQNIVHDATESKVTEGPQHDDNIQQELESVTQVSQDDDATERIFNDDAEAGQSEVTENSQDAPATEESLHDATTERIHYDDSENSVTESGPVLVAHSDDDDAHDDIDVTPSQDEPVTEGHLNHDDFENVVTEKNVVTADEQQEQQTVKAPTAAAASDDDNQAGVTQASESSSDNKIDVFDVILDDETVPSQPETLNQVRESILSENEVNSLLERVRNADQAEMVRISGSGAPEDTTALPTNDDNVEASTSVLGVVNDEEVPESSTVLNDAEAMAQETEAPFVTFNDNGIETQTQREFRDAISISGEEVEGDLLRHHINGLPHKDEEQVSTTVVPPQQGRLGEDVDVSVTTGASVFEDEPVVTTVTPEVIIRNKVQKVAETLVQQNIIPDSLEVLSQNKFRLEPEIFGGGSLEIGQDEGQGIDVTTTRAEVYQDEQIVTTTGPLASQDDVATTESVVNDGVELTTEGIAADEPVVTESNGLVQNDEEEVVVTTGKPVVNVEEHLDDDLEGSGSHHDDVETEAPVVQDPTEASALPLARLDLDESEVGALTAVVSLNDDLEVVTTAAPNSYSFRMDLLNSFEEVAEGGSENGEILTPTLAPSPSNPGVQSHDAIPVTEAGPSADDSEPASPTTGSSAGQDFQNDEPAASGTTESVLSRFRTDLEIETEAPVASESSNDFVEVSTGAPSGFAEEFRDNEVVPAAVTQAPIIPEAEEAASNDQPEPVANTQAPDIISEDDESVTQANIPILNLVAASNDAADAVTQVNNDEAVAVTQRTSGQVGASQDDEEEPIANDESVTPEVVHDEAVTEGQSESIVNDEAAVTSAPEVIPNDEAVTQAATESVANDEAVTSSAPEVISNDKAVTAEAPSNDETVTSAPEVLNNDEAATSTPEANSNDEPATESTSNDDPQSAVTSASEQYLQDEPASTDAPSQDDATGTSPSSQNDDPSATQPPSNDQPSTDDPIIFSDDSVPQTTSEPPSNRLRSDLLLADSIEQQTEQASDAPLQNDDATETPINDDISVTTTLPPPKNATSEDKQSRNKHVILQKIQPISPEIGRNNPYQLRFDFPLPPEKDNSWLSRAVNQFRRLAGFTTTSDDTSTSYNRDIPSKTGYYSRIEPVNRVRVPSRRFLLF